MDIYNVAIVAHVDHGKTTLVDALLKASESFNEHKGLAERAMDSNIEKNVVLQYTQKMLQLPTKEKIKYSSTPGHADFGSEVERVLRTVDAVILVVDMRDQCLKQSLYLKSLELGHKVLVVINKIDKPAARPDEVVDLTFDYLQH